MRVVVVVLDLLLWLVQGVVMLLFVVPLQRLAQLLTWVSWKVIKGPYYFVVQSRRRMKGEPLWKDTDIMIGIQPPRSEWQRLGVLDPDDIEDILK
jgi:hypothetical protein